LVLACPFEFAKHLGRDGLEMWFELADVVFGVDETLDVELFELVEVEGLDGSVGVD
jgi:hypothetical protein